MVKLSGISAIFVACMLVLSGCGAPKGDPKQVLDSYYQNIKGHNPEAAYELLTKANKEKTSKEDFVLYMRLSNETQEFKTFKTTKVKESKDVNIEGNTYKNAVEFDVTEGYKSNFDGKEGEITYKRSVVNDDDEWKVYAEKDFKKFLPEFYVQIGSMYAEGKGKEKNLNEAAKSFNEAIKLNKDYLPAYYFLAATYSDLQRYDESNQKINYLLSKSKDSNEKSDAYNLQGINYENTGKIEDAKEAYAKAVELNPGNEYAKSNLSRLK